MKRPKYLISNIYNNIGIKGEVKNDVTFYDIFLLKIK